MIRILGLDISLRRTGWALSRTEVGSLIPAGALGLEEARNNWIARKILQLAKTGGLGHEPGAAVDVVLLEDYSFGSNMAGSRSIAELGGLVRWMLWSKGIPFVEVPPASLKQFATGKGNAAKEDVLGAAIRTLGYTRNVNDEADALWLFEMGQAHYNERHAPRHPATNRQALKKIKWAELAPRPLPKAPSAAGTNYCPVCQNPVLLRDSVGSCGAIECREYISTVQQGA